jgi:very-short-patch-repair endonuclease
MNNQNLFNRRSLKFIRSALRNKSSSAEAELWNILKSKNLDGRKFRRQHCIGFQEPEFVKNEIRKTFKRKDPEIE